MSALWTALLIGGSTVLLQAGAETAPSPAFIGPRTSGPGGPEDVLQSIQREALPQLIQSITEKKTTPRLRLIQTIGDLQGHQASPYLMQSYNESRNEGVRCKLIESMGKFRDPTLLPWFSERLKDPSVRIQAFAIWSLGELRQPAAIPPLRKKLWSSNRFVQMTAIDALGKTGRNATVAIDIAVFLTDDDVQFRYLAAKALGGAGSAVVVPALFQRLDAEPSMDVQEVLAQAIGQIGGPVAIGHLIDLLKYAPSQATEHWAEVGLAAADPAVVRTAIRPLVDSSDFRQNVSASRVLKQLDEQMKHPGVSQ